MTENAAEKDMRERLQSMKAEGYERPPRHVWSTIVMHSGVPLGRACEILAEVYGDEPS